MNEEQIQSYRGLGYHLPVHVLSDGEVRGSLCKLRAHEERHGRLEGRIAHRSHVLFTWVNELIRHPRILDAVQGVLGPDILCWNTNFFIKDARSGSFVSWHQDATYWGLSAPDVVTVWLALTRANKRSGCMKVIPGSHGRQVPHEDTFEDDNLLTRGQRVSAPIDEGAAVHLELEAGQASLHHALLFHASEPNLSDERRIGLAIRYVAPHVGQVVGTKDWATLVRGRDRFHHFEPEHVPQQDLEPAALAFHHAASEEQRRVLYQGLLDDL